MEVCGNESSEKYITCAGICKRQSVRRNRYSDPDCICNHYSDPSDFGNRGLFEFQDGIADEYDQSSAGGIHSGFVEISSRRGRDLETVFDFRFLDSDRRCDRVGN